MRLAVEHVSRVLSDIAKHLPCDGQQFVRVSDAMVAELRANPSRPVVVHIVGDGPELEMLFTPIQGPL